MATPMPGVVIESASMNALGRSRKNLPSLFETLSTLPVGGEQ
jgi:hypothetical protein